MKGPTMTDHLTVLVVGATGSIGRHVVAAAPFATSCRPSTGVRSASR